MVEELYLEHILEHYKNPLNKGVLDPCDHKAFGENPSCGDEITIYLTIERKVVKDISFEGDGCAISIAAASLLTEQVKGIPVEEFRGLTPKSVYELLGVEVSPGREKCALLPLRTLKKALNNKPE